MAITVIVGILAGLAPALQGSRPDLVESLKEIGRGTTGGGTRQRMRSAFVVAEIALSLVLLVGAVLMVKGVNAIFRMNFNFEPQSVLTMRMTLPESKYKDSAKQAAFYDRMLQSVGSLSGVKEAALASVVPFGIGGASDDFSIEGQPARPDEYRTANRETISPSYFRLLHVALREGREFTNADAADRPQVAIISESLARRFWPGESALGRHIKMGRDDEPSPWLTIAGVVSDVTYQIFDRNPPYAIYLPYQQQSYADTYLVVRTTSDPRGMIPAIRGSVASVDPDQPVYDAMTLERVISNAIVGLSYVAANMGILGLIALVLASVGVYGVMAYAVTERTHEIGVRLALGARPRDVMRMLISRGLVLTAIGIAIGLPLTFALARLLASLLFGVSATDLISFGGGAAALAGVALLACYFPARRAMRVDPMVALRYE
jgi:putative ABC transport system permease protein